MEGVQAGQGGKGCSKQLDVGEMNASPWHIHQFKELFSNHNSMKIK